MRLFCCWFLMTSVFANPQLKAALAACCPTFPAAPTLPSPASGGGQGGGASPEKPLPEAKGIPGIQRGTPAWLEVNRSSNLARDGAATWPTFHHDRRDDFATA